MKKRVNELSSSTKGVSDLQKSLVSKESAEKKKLSGVKILEKFKDFETVSRLEGLDLVVKQKILSKSKGDI